jgi:23S rRNA (cytosine1962-C5)-methyltransferase
LDAALARRRALIEALASEGTDCCRLFHGIAEGFPGLAVDRYGPLVLAQAFREPLSAGEERGLEEVLRGRLGFPFELACVHRPSGPGRGPSAEFQCREFGVRFLVRARHRGIDPWLFLDLRCGRRALRSLAAGRSVLNLFAYTCTAGVCAAAAGASEVWNVDFAASSLEVGRRNASLNAIPEVRFKTMKEDCLPAVRQLAGLSPGGRRGQGRRFARLEPKAFDLVFLDPPAWAKGPFGAVDAAGDYPSLFKPALLSAKPGGGVVIAANHAPSVSMEAWLGSLERCALKAGRPLRSIRTLPPEEDFPSFDGKPPLKVAVCEV